MNLTSAKNLLPISSLVLLVPHLAAYGLERFWLQDHRARFQKQPEQTKEQAEEKASSDDEESDYDLFVPEDELEEGERQDSEEGEYDEDLAAEEQNRSDVARFFQLPSNVNVFTIETEEECETLMKQLLKQLKPPSSDGSTLNTKQVLGFDIEWKPNSGSRKHLTSLIQLSTATDCYLIRLCKFSCFRSPFSYSSPLIQEGNGPDTDVSFSTPCLPSSSPCFPSTLREILEHPFILKSGVAVYSDARKLYQDFGVQMKGLIDLQAVVTHRKDLHQLYAQSGTSLSALCGSVLGKPLAKHHWIRCSNWEAHSLSADQTRYAATDAYVGHAILTTISSKVNSLQLEEGVREEQGQTEVDGEEGDEESDNRSTKEDGERKETQEEDVDLCWCFGIVDKRSVTSNIQKATSKPKKSGSTPRQISDIRKPHRKTALFYNCKILGPNGDLLCCCDMKRLDWYLRRGLADKEPGEIPAIRLKFQPRGKGHAGDAFHLSWKENRCVRCGSYESFSKHSVVPHIYRAHFPEEAKSYNNHDTLLLCTSCAPLAWDAVEKLKQQIADETGIPLTLGLTRWEIDKDTAKVKGCATSLKKTSWYKQLCESNHCSSSSSGRTREPSKERLEELLNTIRNWSGREEVTREDIDKACKLEIKRVATTEHETHSKAVVARLKTVEDYQLFVQRWRQNFLDALQPKYMPTHWSVTHPLLNPNGTRTFRLPPVLNVGDDYSAREEHKPQEEGEGTAASSS